ncbi:hypothetical protein SAMN06265367_10483 [Algoriphagus winogradskyi]|uniref:Uncharacterized protein n=1 Tax=Algoriphagus winogradskyi TaxID=237017 RepID=A0ABY1P2E3_9BACT|nr:hypothetical protein SAMN06265367_10483 [Algoriphagus winogradskyi]
MSFQGDERVLLAATQRKLIIKLMNRITIYGDIKAENTD